MPDIILNLPANSRFSSSLNEIDAAMKEIFLTEILIADPRDKTHKQNSQGTGNNLLWESDRVFQVDEMTTEDIFDTWLLRHSHVNKNVDVTYPLLAYKQNDIDTVFWGTGNRYKEWIIETRPENSEVEIGDRVIVVSSRDVHLFGLSADVADIKENRFILYYADSTDKIKDKKGNVIEFTLEELRQTGDKLPITYKAKAITCTYSAVVLVDNRDEAQYLRDHLILRCNDANIWFRYKSPLLNNTENQIYTVFEVPTLERYPQAIDKLKGKGYIYGVGWDVNVWATVTDTPIPSGIIEKIRLNIKTDSEERYRRYIIS